MGRSKGGEREEEGKMDGVGGDASHPPEFHTDFVFSRSSIFGRFNYSQWRRQYLVRRRHKTQPE